MAEFFQATLKFAVKARVYQFGTSIDIKTKIDCLRFVCARYKCQSSKAFFAAAINSTNEANKAGSMCH